MYSVWQGVARSLRSLDIHSHSSSELSCKSYRVWAVSWWSVGTLVPAVWVVSKSGPSLALGNPLLLYTMCLSIHLLWGYVILFDPVSVSNTTCCALIASTGTVRDYSKPVACRRLSTCDLLSSQNGLPLGTSRNGRLETKSGVGQIK